MTALVEVWQRAERHPDAAGGFLKFLTDMARLASLYVRNYQRRQMTGQQQLWLQLETFSRKIHGSLNPTEVSYVIANEGRRLIDCDRVSVALCQGRKTRIEAVSGADVVEKRSNLVRLMRKLCSRVARWGEKLVYSGTKDDTLPPKVLDALDKYLAESNSKLLVVMPLRDEREKNTKKRPRSVLLMECFEPPAAAEQLLARLDVIGQHVTGALYNAAEYRRIPFRFVWKPMANVQEGLGGKARVITLVGRGGRGPARRCPLCRAVSLEDGRQGGTTSRDSAICLCTACRCSGDVHGEAGRHRQREPGIGCSCRRGVKLKAHGFG